MATVTNIIHVQQSQMRDRELHASLPFQKEAARVCAATKGICSYSQWSSFFKDEGTTG